MHWEIEKFVIRFTVKFALEQWLHFAGAAVKRYPTSKVRENQVRW